MTAKGQDPKALFTVGIAFVCAGGAFLAIQNMRFIAPAFLVLGVVFMVIGGKRMRTGK